MLFFFVPPPAHRLININEPFLFSVKNDQVCFIGFLPGAIEYQTQGMVARISGSVCRCSCDGHGVSILLWTGADASSYWASRCISCFIVRRFHRCAGSTLVYSRQLFCCYGGCADSGAVTRPFFFKCQCRGGIGHWWNVYSSLPAPSRWCHGALCCPLPNRFGTLGPIRFLSRDAQCRDSPGMCTGLQ